jgi:hypothetical protein
MKIILTEQQVETIVNELGTKPKEVYDKGAFHDIYQSKNNPNVLYKIGTKNMVDSWVDIFKSRPDLFPIVYKTGTMNYKLPKPFTEFIDGQPVKHEAGESIKVSYVEIERLDVRQAVIHWDRLDEVVKQMTGKSLQTYLTVIGLEDPMENEFNEIGEQLKDNKFIYDIFVDFYNLLSRVYEIKPAADVHKRNFGYDKNMNLKMLDI